MKNGIEAIEIVGATLEEACWKKGKKISADLHPFCVVKRGFV
jgi:hypothetical protein